MSNATLKLIPPRVPVQTDSVEDLAILARLEAKRLRYRLLQGHKTVPMCCEAWSAFLDRLADLAEGLAGAA